MKYRVYSKNYCPFCTKAIKLLSEHGKQFESIDLTDNSEAFEALKKRTGMQTVPQIFEETDGVEGRLIGGFDSLKAMFDMIQRSASYESEDNGTAASIN